MPHINNPNKPKQKLMVGKIFADWCGHCVALKKEWEKMKRYIKLNMGRKFKNVEIEFIEIGDTEANKKAGKTVDGMIGEFNNTHMSASSDKLALDGGYPTVFKYCNGKLEYYKGERSADALYKWSMSSCSNGEADMNTDFNNKPRWHGGAKSHKKSKSWYSRMRSRMRSSMQNNIGNKLWGNKHNKTRKNRWFS